MGKFEIGSLNQVASGTGAVNQVGEITNTNNIGAAGDSLSIEQVFAAIVAAVEAPAAPVQQSSQPPPAEPIPPSPTMPAPDAPVQNSPLAQNTVAPLQAMACMPLAQQTQPDIQSKAAYLIERLIPYAPQIGKGLATFGAAALESLANRNPIVAGLCAVCKQAKDMPVA